MKVKKIPPIHPGEILIEEFLKPVDISQNQLGRDLRVSPRRINEIVHGRRSISADTALRLAAYFGDSPSFGLGLQMDYDLDVAEDAFSSRIKKEVRHVAVAQHCQTTHWGWTGDERQGRVLIVDCPLIAPYPFG